VSLFNAKLLLIPRIARYAAQVKPRCSAARSIGHINQFDANVLLNFTFFGARNMTTRVFAQSATMMSEASSDLDSVRTFRLYA
jgi:hypothetical protein